jgi:hypothetical protein
MPKTRIAVKKVAQRSKSLIRRHFISIRRHARGKALNRLSPGARARALHNPGANKKSAESPGTVFFALLTGLFYPTGSVHRRNPGTTLPVYRPLRALFMFGITHQPGA